MRVSGVWSDKPQVRRHTVPLSLDDLVNDFALRSLRETGDKDYVHARLAYQSRLIPQFLWSSLHCLEKYTKCVLVLNRIDARSLRHQIEAGIDLIGQSGKFEVTLSEPVWKFIRSLESGARFRYYETSYHAEGLDLARLDRAVWELRRYCQPLDYNVEVDGVQTNLLTHNIARMAAAREAGDNGTCVIGGWLEGVLCNPKHPARKALIWQNLFFDVRRRATIKVTNWFEAGNSPLYLHPSIVEEVAKYIKVPNEIKEAYSELEVNRKMGPAE